MDCFKFGGKVRGEGYEFQQSGVFIILLSEWAGHQVTVVYKIRFEKMEEQLPRQMAIYIHSIES